jgi:tannase/feruloyl esterase
MCRPYMLLAAVVVVGWPSLLFAQQSGSCERIASLTLPKVSITLATRQAAAAWLLTNGTATVQPAGATNGTTPSVQLPAFCRVAITLKPSADSNIEGEIWLPLRNWNGKFQEVGNGGWAGSITYPGMAYALQDGYATAATDTGHKGANSVFAIGHPEKLLDLGERSVHEMAVAAKAVIAAFYDRAPARSYWNGCSTGGRQGLMAAQKYPNDFDGIVAGAPANNWAHMHAWDMSVSKPVFKDPAGKIPAASLAMLNRAVIQACDQSDGITDGIISNPKACTFDPAVLQCRESSTNACLTPSQVESARRMYTSVNDRTGRVVFPGKERGSESGWAAYLDTPQPLAVAAGSFQLAYGDPSWDVRTFDLERDLALVEQKISPVLDATKPDLRAFKAHGGKLLLYHGWADNLIPPQNTINYYSSVLEAMPGKQEDFIRLFMAPGMFHCAGGPGPNQVNWVAALDRWRATSTAPTRIEAAHISNNRVDMTRPLCPYPQTAVYSGNGSTNDAESFSCKMP